MKEHFRIQDKIFDVLYFKYDYKNPFFYSLNRNLGLNFNELNKPMVHLRRNYGVITIRYFLGEALSSTNTYIMG